MGTPEFSVPCLEMLLHSPHEVAAVVTQPDRPQGRGLVLEPPPVKRVAVEHEIEVLQPETLSDPDFLGRLAEIAPDLGVVIAFGHILKPELLELPKRGCLNVHASLLPRLRGPAPIAWAILTGETETGVTTIRMDPGMDTGPIFMQKSIEIAPEETAGTLHDRLAELGAEALVETLQGLEQGSLRPRAQDHGQATYAPKFKKTDGLLDFCRPARELERRVRALDPWPGAFFHWQRKAIKVWKAAVVSASGQAGQVLAADKEGITVACSADALRLTELQPPGKRRMSAAEFLAGHLLPAGSRLHE